MIVCPVCENPQQEGLECGVCGKDLGGVLGSMLDAPVVVERVPGLEVTIPERVGEVPVERTEGVEVTSLPKVAEVPVERFAEFEQTATAKVGEIPVLPIEDLTEDRALDDGVRTAIPTGPLTCRYCRNQQLEGMVCDKCGMRLPIIPVAAPAGTAKKPAEVIVRCKVCAAPAVAGKKCGECGRDVPFPDA
jgi:hypothetical protein